MKQIKPFKEEFTFEERVKESKDIIAKYPDRVPPGMKKDLKSGAGVLGPSRAPPRWLIRRNTGEKKEVADTSSQKENERRWSAQTHLKKRPHSSGKERGLPSGQQDGQLGKLVAAGKAVRQIPSSTELNHELDKRFQNLKRNLQGKTTSYDWSLCMESKYSHGPNENNCLKTKSKVTWADRFGDPLCTCLKIVDDPVSARSTPVTSSNLGSSTPLKVDLHVLPEGAQI